MTSADLFRVVNVFFSLSRFDKDNLIFFYFGFLSDALFWGVMEILFKLERRQQQKRGEKVFASAFDTLYLMDYA